MIACILYDMNDLEYPFYDFHVYVQVKYFKKTWIFFYSELFYDIFIQCNIYNYASRVCKQS